MSRAVDVAVAIPILGGGVLNGLIALTAAAPAIAVAAFRVERTIWEGRNDGPY